MDSSNERREWTSLIPFFKNARLTDEDASSTTSTTWAKAVLEELLVVMFDTRRV